MKSWIPWSLFALTSWGFWGLFPKLATNHINPASALVFEALGGACVGLFCFFVLGGKLEVASPGPLFGFLAGLAALTGGWCYVNAVSRGRVSLIVAVTAMYPVVTIVLAHVILREPVSLRQALGVVFAVAAIVLVAT
jgi:bacterial/archaeal transporter family protein